MWPRTRHNRVKGRRLSMSDEAEKATDRLERALDPAKRDGWTRLGDDGEIDDLRSVLNDAREVESLRAQLAEREAVIEQARETLSKPIDLSKVLDTPEGRALWKAVLANEAQAILAASSSTVLADLIREKQAEAWNERGRDTFPFASKLNPYRKGAGQ